MVAQGLDGAGGFGVGDHSGELGRHRDQKGLFRLIKAAPLMLLHHQHPQHIPLMDDGHPKEGVESLLTGGLKVNIGRVDRGVLQVQRLGALPDQPHNPLTGGQAGVADRFRVEPLGCHQDITPGSAVQ